MRYLCEAYQIGIAIRNDLYESDLATAFENIDHSIDAIEDGYPAWHPAPFSFRAMVLAFVFMEITGDSYAAFTRRLTRQPEVATLLGFSRSLMNRRSHGHGETGSMTLSKSTWILRPTLSSKKSTISTFLCPKFAPRRRSSTSLQ